MISWLSHTLRGACMGVADAIPGVSGGTLALILGIYERFVAAISAVGPGMVRAVFTKDFWRCFKAGLLSPGDEGNSPTGKYASHVLFLMFLMLGIGLAIITVARFIPTLLATHPEPMHGFFFGLVLASIVIPYKMMKARGPKQGLAFVLAAVATFFVVALPLDQSQKSRGEVIVTLSAPASEAIDISPAREGVVFMTARHGGIDKKREVAFLPATTVTIAPGQTRVTVPIVARLAGKVANLAPGELVKVVGLPDGAAISQLGGTSGGGDPALWFVFIAGVIAISAMVLPGISGAFLLLMLGLYNYIMFNIRAFVYERNGDAFVVLAVFGTAVIIGILSFSRVIHWLLRRYHDTTLAALTGIMLGSLRKLWPFQSVDAGGHKHAALPDAIDSTFAITIGAFVVGVIVVFALDRWGSAKASLLTDDATA